MQEGCDRKTARLDSSDGATGQILAFPLQYLQYQPLSLEALTMLISPVLNP